MKPRTPPPPPPEPIGKNQPFLPKGATAVIVTATWFGADMGTFQQDVALHQLTPNIRKGFFQATATLPGRIGRQVIMTDTVHIIDDAGELCTVEWTQHETSDAQPRTT